MVNAGDITSLPPFHCMKASEEGGIRKNGKVSTHNGLMGMLEREEIDIALADLALTLQRAEVKHREAIAYGIKYFFFF